MPNVHPAHMRRAQRRMLREMREQAKADAAGYGDERRAFVTETKTKYSDQADRDEAIKRYDSIR